MIMETEVGLHVGSHVSPQTTCPVSLIGHPLPHPALQVFTSLASIMAPQDSWDEGRALKFGQVPLVMPSLQPHLHHLPLPSPFQLPCPLHHQALALTALLSGTLLSPCFAPQTSPPASLPQGGLPRLDQTPLLATHISFIACVPHALLHL